MTDPSDALPDTAPDYRWATVSAPDVLVLQLPPVATGQVGEIDAMRSLLGRRGFGPIARADDLDLRPANGCLLTRRGETDAELLLRIGESGASRIPLSGLDPAWLTRVVGDGLAAVLAVEDAIAEDRTTSRDLLLRDVEAGGVLGALVPCGDAAS